MPPTHRFPGANAAYCWAFEIREGWRNGRAFDPDPEQFRGGMGGMGAVIMALSVMKIAERHDIVNGTGSWFEAALIAGPDPQEFHGERKRRLDHALCRFCHELDRRGLLDENFSCILHYKRCRFSP